MKKQTFIKLVFWIGLIMTFTIHWSFILMPMSIIFMIALTFIQVPTLSISARKFVWEMEKTRLLKKMGSPIIQLPLAIFLSKEDVKNIYIEKGPNALRDALLEHVDKIIERCSAMKDMVTESNKTHNEK